ncbi:histidine kinase [Paucibacter sp. O1-1]|nr:histidine kinase [Paucibacter sp. O1-1]MDA3830583.1 histidine kinase [Paucibacter sp. O1-1]
MTFQQELATAWRRQWRLSKQRDEALWARLLITALLALGFGLAVTGLALLLNARVMQSGAWVHVLQENLIISGCVSFTIMAGYRLLELALSEAWLARINADRGGLSVLVHAGLVIVCMLLGGALGLTLLGWLLQLDSWAFIARRPQTVLEFLVIGLVISLISSLCWQWRLRAQARQLRATEAQLKLLQAQIEPHFLFNTLATVHSLMEQDAPRAKRMLESFTDYLRASLGQLRSADATLATELAMADSYLQLMQARMDERLRYVISAEPAAREALLPPLLLQPLIENAIHHGLEPKLDGGQVRVSATLAEGRLRIEIADDGLGLNAAPRARRGGHGLALENIRARLQARHGDAAALQLQAAAGGGTLAILTLPFITQTP